MRRGSSYTTTGRSSSAAVRIDLRPPSCGTCPTAASTPPLTGTGKSSSAARRLESPTLRSSVMERSSLPAVRMTSASRALMWTEASTEPLVAMEARALRSPPGSWTTAIAVQRDGQIVAAGVTGYPGIDFAVARFDPAGRLDLGSMTSRFPHRTERSSLPVSAIRRGPLLISRSLVISEGLRPARCRTFAAGSSPLPKRASRGRGAGSERSTRKPSKKAQKGRVLSQSPRAGAMVPSGAKAKLVVGKGRKH